MVSYDRFHVFASGFTSMSAKLTETLRNSASVEPVSLAQIGDGRGGLLPPCISHTPMHFTECPLYSPLTRGDGLPARTPSEIEQGQEPGPAGQQPTELLTLKPGVWGMNIDLKEAARRLRQRLKKS
jgi:hypothetical protein